MNLNAIGKFQMKLANSAKAMGGFTGAVNAGAPVTLIALIRISAISLSRKRFLLSRYQRIKLRYSTPSRKQKLSIDTFKGAASV